MSNRYKTYEQLAPQKKPENSRSRVIPAISPGMANTLILDPNHRFSIVDIFATWCSPCMTFKPKFEEMSLNYPHIRFISIDIDNEEFANSQYTSDVTGVPTFKIFESGQLKNVLAGPSEEQIKEILTSLK